MNTNKELKRFIMDIDPNLHAEIKSRAARRLITMKKYVIIAILEMIAKENKYE